MRRLAISTLVQQNVSSSRQDDYARTTAINPSLQLWLSSENHPTDWCSFPGNANVVYLPSPVEHDHFMYNNYGGSPPLESMASINWFNGFDPSSGLIGQPQLFESNVRNTYNSFVPQEDVGPHAGTSLSFYDAMTRERDIVAQGGTNHDNNDIEQGEPLSSRSCSSESETESVFPPRTRPRNTVSYSRPMSRHYVCPVSIQGIDCQSDSLDRNTFDVTSTLYTYRQEITDVRCLAVTRNSVTYSGDGNE
jgi:hypothetical protein